ncbi:hypothetical protein JTE90_023639 [Oedothorax gibbosus]|uniref:RRM domain-containing protein n=1 Tax=Oedothorax gibbosus TaxID=931172 RepID=A0AAV6TMN3_9ARAC|nr:hypothetical protein JTE90_023639 [Oedothorax gibbosus]
MAGLDKTTLHQSAFVEFTDRTSIVKALQCDGITLKGSKLKIAHSSSAIVKPQKDTEIISEKDTEEAMKRLKEAESLIARVVEPEISGSKSSRSRRRSSSRSRRRSSSRSRRRSRSASRRSSRKRTSDLVQRIADDDRLREKGEHALDQRVKSDGPDPEAGPGDLVQEAKPGVPREVSDPIPGAGVLVPREVARNLEGARRSEDLVQGAPILVLAGVVDPVPKATWNVRKGVRGPIPGVHPKLKEVLDQGAGCQEAESPVPGVAWTALNEVANLVLKVEVHPKR